MKDLLMNLMASLNATVGGEPNEACELGRNVVYQFD